MKKLTRTAVSLLSCLAMMSSLIPVPTGADYLKSENSDNVHTHEHAPYSQDGVATAAESGPALASDAPAVETSRVAISEKGITVTVIVPSGHFHSATYVCDTPTLSIASDRDITDISATYREYGNAEEAPLDNITKNIEGKTATVEFVPGQNGYVKVSVTAGSDTVTVDILISHGMGKRDKIDYDATCTRPKRTEHVYYCDICPTLTHRIVSIGKDEQAKGHDFEEQTIDVSECEGEGKSVTVKICKTCGYTEYKDEDQKFDEEKHSFTKTVDVAPTCKSDGSSNLVCEKCGAIKISEQVQNTSLSHDLPGVVDAERIPPTCTEYGKVIRKCRNCDLTETALTGMLKHNWVIEERTKEPDCKEDGVAVARCSYCGQTDENYVLKSPGHVYALTTVKEATCTENGKQAFACIYCNEIREGTERDIPKTNHVRQPDDGDCTTPVSCSRCGEILVEAKQHNFGTRYYSDGTNHWLRCKNSGCTGTSEPEKHISDGNVKCTQNFTCKVCGRYCSGVPHTYGKEYENENNLYHKVTCEVCGEVQRSMHVYVDDRDCTTPLVCKDCGKVKTPAKEHVYAQWVNEGEEKEHVRDCINENCDHEERLPHNFDVEPVIENMTDATCTASGSYDSVLVCPDCRAVKTEHVIVEAKGHSFGEWIVEPAETCDGAGIKYRECTVCKYRETQGLDPSSHDWEDTYTVDREASCIADGSESIHCKKCSATKDAKVIPQTDHAYGAEPERVVLATCTDAGANIYACTVCGKEKTEIIEAAGHQYGEYVYNEDASCKQAGTHSRTCTECKYVETEPDPEHGKQQHLFTVWTYQNNATIYYDGTEISYCDYKCGVYSTRAAEGTKLHEHTFLKYNIIKEETCTEDRVVESVCEVCGKEKDTKTVEGTALGHSEGLVTVVTDADCTHDAVGVTVCVRCGETMRTNIAIEGSALGHSFSDYVYNNDATTEEDGTETATCTRCGTTDTRRKEGTKLEGEHVFTKYVYNNDATCTNGTETAYCDNGCGSTDTREALGTALGHNYSETKTVSKATCTENEIIESTCERCGDKVTSTVDGTALGHDLSSLVIVVPATCTEDAQGEFHCSRCEYVSDTKTIEGSKLDHRFGGWITETESTCVDDGRMYRECSVCGLREYDRDPADGHVWDKDFTVDIPATCDRNGSKSIHCSVCGATKEETVIPRREHDFKVTKTVQPTCTADGYEIKTCSYVDCNYQEHNTIAAIGHSYGEPVNYDGKNPCVDDGYTVTVCENCGDKVTTVIPGTALGHDYVESLVPATCTEDGKATYTCQRCEDSYTETREGTALGHIAGKGKVTVKPTPENEGKKEITCERCGELIETVTLEKTVGVETESGAPNVDADISEVLDAIGLSDEDKAAMDEGELRIVLEVSDALGEVTAEEIDEVVSAAQNSSLTVAKYYEIDIVRIETDGENETRQKIENIGKPITVTLTVPEELRAENRVFSLIRLHGGKAEILSDIDSDPNTVTVSTDRFSIYTLAYSDAELSEHTHRPVFIHDSYGHTMICMTCGERMMYGPHSFSLGRCTVCGYVSSAYTAPSGGVTVDVQTPTEASVNIEE